MEKKMKKNAIKGNIWVKFVVLLFAVTLGSSALLCGLATLLFGADTDLQGTEAQLEQQLDERLLQTYAAMLLDNLVYTQDGEAVDGFDALDGGNIRYTLVCRKWEGETYSDTHVYSNRQEVTAENCMADMASGGYYDFNAAGFLNALAGTRHVWYDTENSYQYIVYLSVGELWNRGGILPAEAAKLKVGLRDYTYDAAVLAKRIGWFRHTCGWWLVGSGILFLVCFVFLMSAAGVRSGQEEVCLRWVDRIWLELYLAAIGFVELCVCGGLALTANDGISYGSVSVSFGLGLMAVLLLFGVFVALLLCMSLAVRVKAHKLWRYTLLHGLLTPVRSLCDSARKNTSLYVKGFALMAGVSFLELLLFSASNGEADILLLYFVLYKIVEIPVVMHVLVQMDLLKKGGMRIAAGDYSQPIDTRKMLWEFKRHGENINSVGNGISLAVEERMKSERFKTELITNVSHDIKTPLTSIINYVDLMQKQEITDPTMLEYMAVLERQSARLKKLIEDLMEASKASTGNLPVNLEECDAAVMLSQAIGEFEERSKEQELELIVTSPDEPVHILADGRHLWRIYDNLMSNICKYAMPGTRVYIDLERFNGMVIATFRNISRTRLNISSAELMERFVRGDSSRNTEGSGLGLSIAQSLANLMNGNMAIQIDGDLFKAIVSFEEKRD